MVRGKPHSAQTAALRPLTRVRGRISVIGYIYIYIYIYIHIYIYIDVYIYVNTTVQKYVDSLRVIQNVAG